MKNGNWYLVYTYVNTMEAGTFNNGIEKEKILLKAKTEIEAIKEGTTKWADVYAKAIKNWEVQKATYVHPPTTAFNGVDPSPYIIYEVIYKITNNT